MKYKLIKKKVQKGNKLYLIESDKFWECYKCKIIYGEGETVLIDEHTGSLCCPRHRKSKLSHAKLDYYKERFILEEIK